MPKRKDELAIAQVMSERSQSHDTRKKLFLDIERKLDRPVVTLFTSFRYPVMLEDTDVDMLAGVLQAMDLSKGMALIVNSPGGDGLAAERMISVCRTYSRTGEYWAIVPGKAKSAATMVCFGSSKIFMGPSSELGPVDPQVSLPKGNTVEIFSVFNIIESYNDLFQKAVKAQGNLEPYLQQLANYDAREIKEFESALELSKDISIRALKTGMMGRLSNKVIENKIKMFLTPKSTKTHGRPIYRDEALDCSLNIEKIGVQDDLWRLVYELYIRTNEFVSTQVSKCIESKDNSFVVPAEA